MNRSFYIDKSLCKLCGRCLRECGKHVQIQKDNHINPDNPRCIKCYHCYTICPENAIKLKSKAEAPAFSQELFESITEDNLTNFLAYRRSIRSFQKRDVDSNLIEKLIDKARYIPSGGNSHSYEFTVLASSKVKSDIMDELTEIYKMRSHMLNNPVLRNVVKPFVNKQMRGFLKNKSYRERMKSLIKRISMGDDPFFYHAPVIIIIHSNQQVPTPKEDCVLAGYNIALVAQAMGLGACFVTLAQNAINSSNKCKKIINLSPHDNVNAVIVLGYPSLRHERIAPKPEKHIHWC